MADFLYYLPGKPAPAKQLVERFRLQGVFENCGEAFCEVKNNGPDAGEGGGNGMVLRPKPKHLKPGKMKVGYYPKRQKWFKWNFTVEKEEGDTEIVEYYVGYDTRNPPRPDNLLREHPLRGYPVLLSDGNSWSVPMARMMGQGTLLPEGIIMLPTGEYVKEIIEKYGAFWERSTEFLDAWLDPENTNPEITDDHPVFNMHNLYSFALETLGINYRIGAAEVAVMKLFTDFNLIEISYAAIGMELARDIMISIKAEEKKTEIASTPVTSPTSSGEQE